MSKVRDRDDMCGLQRGLMRVVAEFKLQSGG